MIDAFFRLLRKFPYKEITVSRIVQEADVSRATFYRHFETKEDIVACYANRLCQEVNEILGRLDDHSLHSVLVAYFSYWMEHIEIIHLLKSSECDYLLSKHYREIMFQTMDILREHYRLLDDKEFALAKSFLISGLFQIKMQWLEDESPKNAQEMAALTERILR